MRRNGRQKACGRKTCMAEYWYSLLVEHCTNIGKAVQERDGCMKKYKTIWIVIFLIVVVGCVLTFSTSRLILRREATSSLETADALQLDAQAAVLDAKNSRENVAAPGSETAGKNLYGVSNAQAKSEMPEEYEAGGNVGGYEDSEMELLAEANEEAAEYPGYSMKHAAPGSMAPVGEQQEDTVPSEYLEGSPRPQGRSSGEGRESDTVSEISRTSGTAAVAGSGAGLTETAAAKAAMVSGNSDSADVIVEKAQDAADSAKGTESKNVQLIISPLTGSMEAACETLAEVSYKSEKDRLSGRIADMEKKIADRWKGTDETMTAKMNTAEYERSMWEAEMTQAYSLLEGMLAEESRTTLLDQQAQWEKERSVKAAEAASRYEGSTRENLEYTKACSTITKKRVLQLINTYLDTLAENEGKTENKK